MSAISGFSSRLQGLKKIDNPAPAAPAEETMERISLLERLLPARWKKTPGGGQGQPKWLKTTEALLLATAVCFSMGATDASSRVVSLDHQLMCTCGCAELLGECNHVGCTESTAELAMLRTDIAAGMTDSQIFNDFSAKYGATVLAAPKTHGFDLVAWIAPFAVFAAALLGTILLIRRWGGLGLERAQRAMAPDASAVPAEERERRERIRRETGDDGGF